MFDILIKDILPIFVIMALGYAAGKRGVFTAANAQIFNKLVLTYALPAALFVSIVKADRTMLFDDGKLLIISLVVLVGLFLLSYLSTYKIFKHTKSEAAVSALITGSPTIGFLGFAVLEPIFGTNASVALVVAIVGIVVNAIGIPVGLSLMNASLEKQQPGSTKHQSAWKPVIHALEQPVAWAPILAVIWVVAGIPWPDWASPSFQLMAKANASMAVFSAGITLSALKLNINFQVILGTIMKMLVMPAFVLLLGLVFHMAPLNLKMLVEACSLPPAFSGIIIADEYNRYIATGTSSLTLSILVFIGFCPLWLWLTDLCIAAF